MTANKNYIITIQHVNNVRIIIMMMLIIIIIANTCLLSARLVSTPHTSTHLILWTTFWRKHCYYFDFVDEEREVK